MSEDNSNDLENSQLYACPVCRSLFRTSQGVEGEKVRCPQCYGFLVLTGKDTPHVEKVDVDDEVEVFDMRRKIQDRYTKGGENSGILTDNEDAIIMPVDKSSETGSIVAFISFIILIMGFFVLGYTYYKYKRDIGSITAQNVLPMYYKLISGGTSVRPEDVKDEDKVGKKTLQASADHIAQENMGGQVLENVLDANSVVTNQSREAANSATQSGSAVAMLMSNAGQGSSAITAGNIGGKQFDNYEKVVTLSPEEDKKITSLLNDFLNQRNSDEMIPYLYEGERIKSLLNMWVRTPSQELKPKKVEKILRVVELSPQVFKLDVKFYNIERKDLIVVKNDQGNFLLDWDSYARFTVKDVFSFIDMQEENPTQFYVTFERYDKYNNQFLSERDALAQHKTGYLSYKMTFRNQEHLYAYVALNTPEAAAMKDVNNGDKQIYTVEINFKPNAGSYDQVLIHKVVGKGIMSEATRQLIKDTTQTKVQ